MSNDLTIDREFSANYLKIIREGTGVIVVVEGDVNEFNRLIRLYTSAGYSLIPDYEVESHVIEVYRYTHNGGTRDRISNEVVYSTLMRLGRMVNHHE